MTDDRRGYMPKVDPTVKRTEFLVLPSLAHKFEGTPTRYTPPICRDQTPHYPEVNPPKPCQHAEGYHARHGLESGGGAWGLRYSKRTGAFSWTKPAALKFTEGELPERTLENMAACRALGLEFWAEAGLHAAWAVGRDQRAHLVGVDRKTGKAEHACAVGRRVYETEDGVEDTDKSDPEEWGWRPHNERFDPVKESPREGSRQLCDESIATTADWTTDGLQAELFNNEEDEMAVRDRAKTPVSMGGLTAAEKRIQKAARERREAEREAEYARRDAEIEAEVRAKLAESPPPPPKRTKPPMGMTLAAATALLHHDPDHLGDLPTEHLNTLLADAGEKRHHAKIRKELKSR